MGIAIIAVVTAVVFGAMCLAALIASLISFISDWRYAKERCPVKLKFRHFLDFYAICPDRFELNHVWVKYTMRRHYRTVKIAFGFIDTLRFLYWQHKREKDAKAEADVNKALEFIADMQENIRDFTNGN